MAKSTNNGEPKFPRRTPGRRRTDSSSQAAPAGSVQQAADTAAAAPEAASQATAGIDVRTRNSGASQSETALGEIPGTMGANLVEASGTGSPRSEEIRRRAYALYLERGRTDGMDLEDWLEAERQLSNQR